MFGSRVQRFGGQGIGIRVSGCQVQGSGVLGSGFGGSWFSAEGVGSRVQGFWVLG